MKRFLSAVLSAVIAVTCLTAPLGSYALDLGSVSASRVAEAVYLACDGQWKEFTGKSGADRDYYKITVDRTGKLNIKVQSYSFLEATLSSADLTKDYFTLFTMGSSAGSETAYRNQVITAGTYYLSVSSTGLYKINASFGGNCYENPQELAAGSQVNGVSTETDGGWWYVLNVGKDAVYTFNTVAYGTADITLYNADLTATYDNVISSGTASSPVKTRKNISLPKGKYYIKVDSDGNYSLSWYRLTKDNCVHSYTAQYVKATYTSKGYRLYTCSECGNTYKDSYTAKKKLSAPSIRSLKKGSRKLSVSVNRSFNSTGTQIQYSTNSKFSGKSTKTVTTKDTSKTIKNLKGGAKYYVRVRAYKKVDGKTVYSSWSTAQSVTVKR